jgi:hypothetical protein
MNERIKELADQCQIKGGYNSDGALVEVGFDYEKFAQLIIRECAEVAEDYDGAHYVGTEIKNHFGVE